MEVFSAGCETRRGVVAAVTRRMGLIFFKVKRSYALSTSERPKGKARSCSREAGSEKDK